MEGTFLWSMSWWVGSNIITSLLTDTDDISKVPEILKFIFSSSMSFAQPNTDQIVTPYNYELTMEGSLNQIR